jgi:broad specificity phosphatase PhoE
MILHCVRHGESTYNAEGRLQGQSDRPVLSERGRRQSAAAAEALAAFPIDAIYSSPLSRARQTAEIIAGRLGLEIRSDARLKEIDVGVFEDRLRSEVDALYPAELARWLSGDVEFRIPGGESRRDLARRGVEALEAIARSGVGEVVVVAHGGLLVAAIKALLRIDPDDLPNSLENGSITRLARGHDGRWEVLAIGLTDHLRGIGLAGVGDLTI